MDSRTLGLLFLAGGTMTASSAAGIVYVDAQASGAATGASWTDAFPRLELGLAAALAGDEVWVADGVYKPSPSGDVNQSFVLPNGVALYGGFAGTEATLAERDVEANVAILSGDLAGDTGLSHANLLDNSNNVVSVPHTTLPTRLDGVTVQNGNASSHGGGVLKSLVGPLVIEHCTVRFNRAAIFGGGLFVSGAVETRDCLFHDNVASEGGAVDFESAARVDRCRFIGNVATFGDGSGAIWSLFGLKVTSSVFADNRIYIDVGNSFSYVRASTFAANALPDLATNGPIEISNTIRSADGALARFADPLGPDGTAGTLDDDYRLLPDSPFIDAGNNAGVDASMLFDVDGAPRRVDDPATPDTGIGAAPLVDFGAHEFQPCPPAVNYCIGAPNSVGPGANLAFAGSAHLYAHHARLDFSGLPPIAIGLFYMGTQSVQVAFGNGFRCVGGALGRLGIVTGDAAGVASIDFDPAASSLGLAPGQERFFQHWYRNPAAGGAMFNLSDAVRVTFCP